MRRTDLSLDEEIAEVERRLARHRMQLRHLAAEARSKISVRHATPVALLGALAVGFAAARFARKGAQSSRVRHGSRTARFVAIVASVLLPRLVRPLEAAATPMAAPANEPAPAPDRDDPLIGRRARKVLHPRNSYHRASVTVSGSVARVTDARLRAAIAVDRQQRRRAPAGGHCRDRPELRRRGMRLAKTHAWSQSKSPIAVTSTRAWIAAALIPLAIALGSLAACERADDRTIPGDSIRSGWSSPERPSVVVRAPAPAQRAFLQSVAERGLFEIEASRIAIARGGSAAVRRFAEATLRDRISVDTDLQQLAQSVGVALPTRLDPAFQGRLAVLAQLDPSDFDRAYARSVGVAGQEEALAEFEHAADRRGERIQRFAADQIPALRQRLEWARQLASELDRTKMA